MSISAIAVAHNSAGPKGDIVVEYDKQPTGFLAVTEQEYADALQQAFALSTTDRAAMQVTRSV